MKTVKHLPLVAAVLYSIAALFDFQLPRPTPSPDGPCATVLTTYAGNLSATCTVLADDIKAGKLKAPADVASAFNAAEAAYTNTFDSLNKHLDDVAGNDMTKIESTMREFADAFKELHDE